MLVHSAGRLARKCLGAGGECWFLFWVQTFLLTLVAQLSFLRQVKCDLFGFLYVPCSCNGVWLRTITDYPIYSQLKDKLPMRIHTLSLQVPSKPSRTSERRSSIFKYKICWKLRLF